MALSVAAGAMNAGSEKKTSGSSLRHADDETPPFSIGISRLSPVRLSVMVMVSATDAFYPHGGRRRTRARQLRASRQWIRHQVRWVQDGQRIRRENDLPGTHSDVRSRTPSSTS